MSEAVKEEEDWRGRAEAAEGALERLREESAARIVRSELKAAAVAAGMIDLDGLKLIDAGDVKLNAAGEIDEPQALMAKLKREKPWLFMAGASSSVAANPPKPEPPRVRHANELSDEEWRAARTALLRRR